MNRNIGIAVAVKSECMGDFNSAEEQSTSLDEAMDIISLSDSDHLWL